MECRDIAPPPVSSKGIGMGVRESRNQQGIVLNGTSSKNKKTGITRNPVISVNFRGDERIRTAVEGFADPCLATRPRRRNVTSPHIYARLTGLEPVTYGLEVRCSIQLSYRRKRAVVGAAGFEPATFCSQSRRANRAALRPELI